MKPMILFCLLITLLYGCSANNNTCKKTQDVILENHDHEKAVVTVFNGADSVSVSAEGRSAEKGVLCFDKLSTDGNFKIRLKSAAKDTTIYGWGYFTNGAPSGSALTVTYDNRTVTIKETTSSY